MTDHSKQHYYGTIRRDGCYIGRVYHYDLTGNRIITIYSSEPTDDPDIALDDAVDWAEDKGIMIERD